MFPNINCSGSEDDEDEEDELLQRTGNYLSKKADLLPKGVLDVTRVKDANAAKPSNVRYIFAVDNKHVVMGDIENLINNYLATFCKIS